MFVWFRLPVLYDTFPIPIPGPSLSTSHKQFTESSQTHRRNLQNTRLTPIDHTSKRHNTSPQNIHAPNKHVHGAKYKYLNPAALETSSSNSLVKSQFRTPQNHIHTEHRDNTTMLAAGKKSEGRSDSARPRRRISQDRKGVSVRLAPEIYIGVFPLDEPRRHFRRDSEENSLNIITRKRASKQASMCVWYVRERAREKARPTYKETRRRQSKSINAIRPSCSHARAPGQEIHFRPPETSSCESRAALLELIIMPRARASVRLCVSKVYRVRIVLARGI